MMWSNRGGMEDMRKYRIDGEIKCGETLYGQIKI